jgi:hypothetical protein
MEIGSVKQRIKANKVAKNLDESSKANLVTNALNRLSSEIDKSERWISYPATKKHEDGWELSPYGRALCLFTIHGGYKIESYALPDVGCKKNHANVISEAIEQIHES